MVAFLTLLSRAVEFYILILFIYIILSLLIQFDIINGRQKLIFIIFDSLQKLTEPALAPIRRLMNRALPNMLIDLSPIVLVLLLRFAVELIWEIYRGLA